MKLKNKHSIYV